MPTIIADLEHALDAATAGLQTEEYVQAHAALRFALNRYADQMSDAPECPIATQCLRHPLRELLHQDPYTLRAFQKPRGYAGDAVMLDYVYDNVLPEGTSSIGRRVFNAITRSPNGLSVLARRALLAQRIDAVAASTEKPRVLSVACGHLREADLSEAVRGKAIGNLFALDQDRESLSIVDAKYAAEGAVTTIQSSIKQLIQGGLELPAMDLTYAAGVFDYLADHQARGLVLAMFNVLRPGGRMLIANFTPDSDGRGYMSTFMSWKLIYRTEEELEQLAQALPADRVAEQQVFRDAHRNVVYLEVRKR